MTGCAYKVSVRSLIPPETIQIAMLSGRTILIVEAEYLIALDIQRILDAANVARVIIVGSPAEARAALAGAGSFDLAIIPMPDMDPDALALADSLGAAGIAIVMSSADGAPESAIARLGGIPIVTKPFSDADLIAACLKALAQRTASSPTGAQ